MTDKAKNSPPQNTRKPSGISHPGMMGDGSEEQNLGERGDPAARITENEVDAAFTKRAGKKS